MKRIHHNSRRGFTLIEMLLVIAIIAILASIVIIAINPGRQLAQARNAQRASDLKALNDAANQFYLDYKFWPASTSLTTGFQEVCNTGETSGCLDLSELVPNYLPSIPDDPSDDGTNSNYFIALNSSSERLQLAAASSTEYSLDAVVIATSTSVVSTSTAPGVSAEEECDAECTIVTALREGLVGYWPLDSDSSSQTDYSDNSNTGTVNGATYTASGKVNGAYSFDGSNDNIVVSDDNTLDGTTMTFAAWIDLDYDTVDSWVVEKGPHDNNYEFWSHRTNDIMYLRGGSANPAVAGSDTITTNWHHVAFTITGTTGQVYVDGALDNSGSVAALSATAGDIYIGSNSIPGGYFPGDIDEVSIWNRVLDSDEVGQLYNSGDGRTLILE